MPTFRVIPEEEAKSLLRRSDVSLYVDELKRHKDNEWVIAELGDDENKDQVKRMIKRAAETLHKVIEFGRSPSNTVLFKAVPPPPVAPLPPVV